jgi:hypothetical protein
VFIIANLSRRISLAACALLGAPAVLWAPPRMGRKGREAAGSTLLRGAVTPM